MQLAFQRLDNAMLQRVHEQLQAWCDLIVQSAQLNAPVRTGYLRSHIYAIVTEWVGEIGAEAFYSSFVEFGTRYMLARPFLYPAIQEYLPIIEQILGEAIEKAKLESGF